MKRTQQMHIMGLVCILFSLWMSRQIALDAMPPFIDEGIHLRFAEDQRTISPLIHAQQGRLLTTWLYAGSGAYAHGTFWLARTVTLLAMLPGFAALIGLGKLASGWLGAVLAGLLLLFSPYHQFFGRMAMADPLAAAWVSVSLYFAYRLARRARMIDALLVGATLFIAVGAKVTALPYAGIPLAAASTLGWGRITISQRAYWLLGAMGTLFILTALFTLGLRFFGYDYFFLLEHHNPAPTAHLLSKIGTNLAMMCDVVVWYLGPVLLIACGISVLHLIYHCDWYLLLVFTAPILILSLSGRQSARFFESPFTILLVIAAIGIARVIQKWPRTSQAAIVAAVTVWGVFHWLPFTLAINRDISTASLDAFTYAEYVRSDGSGLGIAEIRRALLAYRAQRVIGIMANCQGLHYSALGQFEVRCPRVGPDGQDIGILTDLMNAQRNQGTFVVLETLPYVPATAPGTQIETLDFESGRPTFRLYNLSP